MMIPTVRIPQPWLVLAGILAGICACFQTLGQVPAFHFHHFTEKDGLSDKRVQSIFRDHNGLLWVGTVNGLNRFDGYGFRKYLPDNRNPGQSISNEGINQIVGDSKGMLWIATNNGLNRIDPNTNEVQVWHNTGRDNGSLPSSFVQGMYMAPGDQLWLSCDNRDLTLLDIPSGTFKTFPLKDFMLGAIPGMGKDDYLRIYQIAPKGSNNLWLGTNKGLFSFDPGTGSFAYHPQPAQLPTFTGQATCPDLHRSGSWSQDVLFYDPCKMMWSQSLLPLPATEEGGRRHVTNIFDYAGQTWILARQGLFFQSHQDGTISKAAPASSASHPIPFGPLSNYHIDGSGALWVGGENGLWKCVPNEQHFKQIVLGSNKEEPIYNTYYRFAETQVQHLDIVLDFYQHTLVYAQGGKAVASQKLPYATGVLHMDASQKLWTTGQNELFSIEPSTRSLHPTPIPAEYQSKRKGSYFIDMATDKAGRQWLANNKEGLLVFDPQKNTWWKPGKQEGFFSESLTSVFVSPRHGTVWIGSEDYGLWRYDPAKNTFKLYQHDQAHPRASLAAYMATGMCEDGLGRLWVATDPGGLSRFDPMADENHAFTNLSLAEGLPNGRCTGVTTDHHGDIWATTLRGMVWVNHKTLAVRSFGLAEGLQEEWLDMPPYTTSKGEIRVGTKTGYTQFHPDSLLGSQADPRILVTSFRIFDHECADSLGLGQDQDRHKITLSYLQNFFTFEFVSSDILNARHQKFSYRLLGFDIDWVMAGASRTASYTNVPPGAYTLEIRSSLHGKWNPPGFVVEIVVLPPFWQTWWFRALSILFIVFCAWALYRWRIRRLEREAALVNEFNQKLARTEMAALRAQMNPHFVFNCLSSINRYILVNQPDEASAYLTKFAKLIRLILDNSRTETVLLSKELEAIGLYVEMEQMRFNNRFSYQLQIAEGLQTEHLEIPPLLIQPYVENAIWHGLMHREGQGNLRIDIHHANGKLSIVVEDNGVGRKKAMELKSRSATVNKSHGMKMSSERIEAINKLYGTHATVHTEDLHDAQGQPSGTRITLSF